jgi:hypothetical protein
MVKDNEREDVKMSYSIEIVYVGSAGHLQRYKVVDADGKYVSGGLFRTWQEAEQFIAELVKA